MVAGLDLTNTRLSSAQAVVLAVVKTIVSVVDLGAAPHNTRQNCVVIAGLDPLVSTWMSYCFLFLFPYFASICLRLSVCVFAYVCARVIVCVCMCMCACVFCTLYIKGYLLIFFNSCLSHLNG